MARKKLGEMMIEARVLTEQSVRAALAEQRRWGGTLGRMFVEMKLVTEPELVRVLSQQLGVQPVDLDKTDIPPTVLELVSGEFAAEANCIPFAQSMKFLDVAMADPTNLGVIDELRIRTQLDIRPHLAGPYAIERALAKFYPRHFGRILAVHNHGEMISPSDSGTLPPRHDSEIDAARRPEALPSRQFDGTGRTG
jgi:type IV pilus assembly protein PilB